MDKLKSKHFADSRLWRAWLKQNHASETEIWLKFFKKHTGKEGLTYLGALEEALCYGWIDTTVRTIDDRCYMQRFTPRRKGSLWSELNRKRMKALVASKRMTTAGLAVFDESAPVATSKLRNLPPIPVPDDLLRALERNPEAKANFAKLTEKYTQLCLRWITVAKKTETRAKRVAEFVELTAKKKRLGMK